MDRDIYVLVACEESQAVCIEFRKRGFLAFSADIQKCSGGHPEWHILGDVLPILDGHCDFKTEGGQRVSVPGSWNLIIAHPPCTYLSNAGAARMYPKKGKIDKERFELAMEARQFFLKFLSAGCQYIAVENPLPMKCVGLPHCSCSVQPFEFGHPYSKRTLLWLKNLPPLLPTCIVQKHMPFVYSSSVKRCHKDYSIKGMAHTKKARSKTFPGIARAMAEQWGEYIRKNM